MGPIPGLASDSLCSRKWAEIPDSPASTLLSAGNVHHHDLLAATFGPAHNSHIFPCDTRFAWPFWIFFNTQGDRYQLISIPILAPEWGSSFHCMAFPLGSHESGKSDSGTHQERWKWAQKHGLSLLRVGSRGSAMRNRVDGLWLYAIVMGQHTNSFTKDQFASWKGRCSRAIAILWITN